jgi:hypothetical protein
MHMDEGWNIVAARGLWAPDNPLSGMTAYSGPFPRWLLAAFGSHAGLWVLRGASVVCNAAALLLIGRMLRRLFPTGASWGWALPLIATTPVWLVTVRHSLEVLAFTPLLCILGLYLLMLQKRWAAFGAGVSWGLSIYNHLIGACFPPSVAIAWLLVYRRRPPVAWAHLLAGFIVGLGPRLLAVALYHDHQLEGSAAKYALDAAVADLKWLPGALWDTLIGQTVFLRYVGAVYVEVWPYWLLALALLIPFVRAPLSVPRHVGFTLLCSLCFAVLATLEAPYLAVRFLLLPVIGLAACAVQLGAAAIERDHRWSYLVRTTAGLLVATQLFYLFGNFYLPWQRGELQFVNFFLGDRSPWTSSEGFLPKQALVRYLRALEPPPEQILAPASLARPLRAMLDDPRITILDPVEATDTSVPTVYAGYLRGELPTVYCVGTGGGRMCFHQIEAAGKYFMVGR